ncbi:MAG: alpha-1,2-fucosyltransferase [Chitinophagaceae bacterium]|nr:alpha-1,2-fucosyltransferase [Chitinophagaceae bacterium]
MIVTELYHGQGLGNQLWSYVVTRTIALDKGYGFGIMCPERFKGAEFLKLDFGNTVVGGSGPEGGPPTNLPDGIDYYYKERDIYYDKYKVPVSDFDPDLLEVQDKTKIEGVFQSEKYIQHRRSEIRNWLIISQEFDLQEFSNENVCILNIRGGEYKGNKDLLLTKKYWMDAIHNMRQINNQMKFYIITDDVKYTRKLLPEYESFHFSIGKDYAIINNAHYLILSNSSFAFFPAWLNEKVKCIIAPKYWARHNISDGFWALSFNLYQGWLWQDRSGKLFSYSECEYEYTIYKREKKFDLLSHLPESKKPSIMKLYYNNIYKILAQIKNKFIEQ